MKRPPRSDDGIGERAQRLLKMLVEHYLAQGTPVASKTLATQPGVDVSPATVRSIMAELEARGLVVSPHTSAGKIPTNLGLRFFVDTLLSVQPLNRGSVQMLREGLNPDLAPARLVESASTLLAEISRMAGVVTLPRREQVSLRQIEFLPLTANRVLVILVVNERDVQNRVIHTDREYGESELVQAANFINREFAGESLQHIRTSLIEGMQRDKASVDQLMQLALDMAAKAFDVSGDSGEADGYVVAGEKNLLHAPGDAEAIRRLFDAFARKRDILHLLDRCLDSDGIQLFIGDESGYELLGDYSVVTAPYRVNGRVAGVLGVIGPTRMAYHTVIPIVDVTARVLGAALDHT
ncbi:MAG TPA: heat-inducible transcriptional repressor HrcA [Pseudomonadales bacterium]|nr:heat-inducible transcriptional repressor HrcA [Pseudomonadales bacterium]